MSISFAGVIFTSALLFYVVLRRSFLSAVFLSIPGYTLGLINFNDNGVGPDLFISIILIVLFVLVSVMRLKVKFGLLEASWLMIMLTSIFWHIFTNSQIITVEYNGIFSEKSISAISSEMVMKNFMLLFYIILCLSMRYLLEGATSEKVLILQLNICSFFSFTALLDIILPTDAIWGILKDHASFPVEVGYIIGASGSFRISGLTAEPSHLVIFAGVGCICSIAQWYAKGRYNSIAYLTINSAAFIFAGSLSSIFFVFGIIILILKLSPTRKMKYIYLIIVITIIFGFQVENVISNAMIKLDYTNFDRSFRLVSMLQALLVSLSYPYFGVGIGNINLAVGLVLYLAASVGWIACIILLTLYTRIILKAFSASVNCYDIGITCVSLSIFLMCLFTKGAQFMFSPYISLLFLSIFVVIGTKKIGNNTSK